MSSAQVSPQPYQWRYAEFQDSNFQIRGPTLLFIAVLFSIILIVTVLFFYSRWFCRRFPPSPPHPHPQPHLGSHDQSSWPPSRGLDPATINNMPIMLYRHSVAGDGNFSETECCICLGIYGDKEKVKMLPECRHCFHSECVDKWLTAHSNCPICRASLPLHSPV